MRFDRDMIGFDCAQSSSWKTSFSDTERERRFARGSEEGDGIGCEK